MFRKFSTSAYKPAAASLFQTLQETIPERVALVKELRKSSQTQIAPVTVGSVFGGMRGLPALYWESSKVDPQHGVTFHGLSIEQCQAQLPKLFDESNEISPETMFWFLLTGKIPSQEQAVQLAQELAQRGTKVPGYVTKVMNAVPSDTHPMTQLSIGITALNRSSKFAKAYAQGVPKKDYWQYVFDDTLELLSALPQLIGTVYGNAYHNGKVLGQVSANKDWSDNLATSCGFTQDSANVYSLSAESSRDFTNLVRLYCAFHADHEGGNVSAHTTHLVASALSDPYLSYSAGVQGLAGPLHGLAAQEVVRFILQMHKEIGPNASAEAIEQFLWNTLNGGRVIPGYGHAVLRKPDPRFSAMINFGTQRADVAADPYFSLVTKLSHVAPKVLQQHGKTKNPFPNVDSSSGILFHHYGMTQTLFYTVVFAGSRAFGSLGQVVWDRILGMPIERPTSVDSRTLQKYLQS